LENSCRNDTAGMKKNKKKKSLSEKYIFGVKAIADYLNVSERNVYIWEQELNFPLHRVGDSSKRTVYASVDEIEKWLRKRPSSQSKKRKKKKTVLGIFVVLCAGVLIILIWNFLSTKNREQDFYVSPVPNPRSVYLEGNYVNIKDGKGKIIWTYIENEEPPSGKELDAETNLDFHDIDRDKANEVIAKEYDEETNRFYLTLFDNDGSRIWQKRFINDQSFRGLLLRSNFYPIRSKFTQYQKKTFILTAWRHRTRFLVVFARYDLKGNLLNEYIHTGHISFLVPLDLNQDGIDEIIFGATNNLLHGEAVLGVLDLMDFKGICPSNRIEPEYQHLQYLLQKYIADEAEAGSQIAYIRFKKTDHFSKYIKTHIFPIFDYADKNIFHIYISPWSFENKGSDIRFEYVFSNQLKLLDIIPNPALRKSHPRLCQECQQDISLQELTKTFAENIYGWEQGKWMPLDKLSLDPDY